jgi:long-chain acyl-CoA synthetase
MNDTLSSRLLKIADRRGPQTAFKAKRDGQWHDLTFDWAIDQIAATAFGLLDLGLEPGTRVAILSENQPEWPTTDYAIMAARMITVPLYTTLIPKQVAYILRDAEAEVVFVSSMEHLATVQSIAEDVPSLRTIVVFYPEFPAADERVMSLESLKERGRTASRENFRNLTESVRADDPVTIVYTSGTTGDPKGVVLTHANFIAEFDTIYPAFEGQPGDSLVSFLPLSHILQRVVDSFALLYGFTIAYAESVETIAENLREIKPSHMVSVPRIYEKIHGRVHSGLQQASPLTRGLFNWALEVGRRFNEAEAGGGAGLWLEMQHRFATALVFKKIHAATGGNIRFYVSTGAPLAKGLADFFDAIGIRIIEAWGMTELSGAVTANTYRDYRFGSVGKPGPGVKLKLTEENEICVRGPIVMKEYWRMPEATAETIDREGWLHTGDVGHIDDDGFVYITDRIKELIVTAGGKNVAPQPLENALKTHEAIAQAMVVGDRRKFIGAVIVPEAEVLEAWAVERGIEADLPVLCSDPQVIEYFHGEVEEIMTRFSRYERVRQFVLVPDEFTQEAGELTPTLKLKRRVLLAKYAEEIDRIYQAAPPS